MISTTGVFVLSFAIFAVVLLSYYLTGRLLTLLVARQMLDTPNERSLHQGSIPRGGGLVIVALLILGLTGAAVQSGRYLSLGGMAIIVSAWAGLSWRDDQYDLSPRLRLSFQVLFALASIVAFGYVTELEYGSGQFINLAYWGAILTFLGIVWMANLYNFMDGMDGLASSQTIVAATTLAFWFYQVGDQPLAIVCLILASASYGFILWNWQPAKVFLGDVGSISIGAFFAVLLVYANTRYAIPVLSLVALFGVFVFDASLTLLRRAIRGEKIWLPHRSHLYQRLAGLAFPHARIVIVQIVLMLCCSTLATISVIDHAKLPTALLIELIILVLAGGVVTILERFTEKTSG